MKLFINGHDKNPVRRVKGSDQTFNCLVCSDAGDKEVLTGDTVDVLIYDNGSRSGTPLLTSSGTLVVATTGAFSITIAYTELATVLVGADLYCFARVTGASLVKISDNPILMENR